MNRGHAHGDDVASRHCQIGAMSTKFGEFYELCAMEKIVGAEPSDRKPKESAATCGLIMPISALDGCSAEHWAEVKGIICESVEGIAANKFNVKLVSDADDVGVIQKRIVQNVYSSDIVVCDVSGKNPNVMLWG
jgi:hypothetical protein